MKTKRFLVLAVVSSMVMSCMGGITAVAVSTELHEAYEVVDPEAAIPVISPESFTLTNGNIEGLTCTGMTKGEVFDSEKGKNVMKLSFNPKAAGSGVADAPNVAASLDGFADLLVDGAKNTISFDYKITGSSDGNVGIFVSDQMRYHTDIHRVGAWLRNSGGMCVYKGTALNSVNNVNNWNIWIGDANWNWTKQLDSDNKHWNRLTFVVDETGKKILHSYLNGEHGVSKNETDMITPKDDEGAIDLTSGLYAAQQYVSLESEVNSLFFNTAGAVDETHDLAVLIDNIRVYEGEPTFADTSAVTSALTLENMTTEHDLLGYMTDGYVMDPVKGAVRRLVFAPKKDAFIAAYTNADVRSGLTGFSPYMTDEKVNTISFDYKLSGSSTNHAGLFLNDYVGASYWGLSYAGVFLNNKGGICMRGDKPNNNQSDWYNYAGAVEQHQVSSNNREWNRLTLEVNQETKKIKAYLNRKFFNELDCSATTMPITNMNSIFFNTKPAVGANNDPTGTLSILLDNISAYPGKAKVTEVDALELINASGIDIDEFNKGESVYVKASVENDTNTEQNYIVILAVYDGKGACVDVVLHELNDVQPGEIGYIDGTTLGVTLPEEAATVKAFLWSAWNSITPLCDFDTATLAAE